MATKGICVRPGGRWERVATPAQIAKAIRGSHEALCGGTRRTGSIDVWQVPTGSIDVWQVHWCQVQNGGNADDKLVPMEVLLGPAREAIGEGKVKYVGLSNCMLEQVRAARDFLPPGRLISVQVNGLTLYIIIKWFICHVIWFY